MSKRERPPNRGSPALTVWIYDTALGAAAGSVRLRHLRERGAIQVHDAITVSWMPWVRVPRIGHLRYETSAAAARASTLGGMLGLMFLPPATAESTGAHIAELAQRLNGTGIEQAFLEEMCAQLHPESSALLVLSGAVDLDVVRPAAERGLARGDVVLMHAQLQHGAPDVLRDAVHALQGHGDTVPLHQRRE